MNKRRKRKRSPARPEDLELLEALRNWVHAEGIETRVESGNFRGGMCRVEGEKEMLFINKKHPLERQIAMLITEIRKIAGPEKPLPPELQARIQSWG